MKWEHLAQAFADYRPQIAVYMIARGFIRLLLAIWRASGRADTADDVEEGDELAQTLRRMRSRREEKGIYVGD